MFNRKLIRLFKAAEGFISDDLRLNRQYEAYCEFLEYKEFELALDSLVELINETEYSINNEYWHNLEKAAELMQLHDSARAINARIK
jgi:hypothetical protein